MKEKEWLWYYSQDEETYSGVFVTREDAILDGQSMYDGEQFHIVEAQTGSLRRYLPDACNVYEMMIDKASEDSQWGEYQDVIASDMPEEAKDALNAALKAWYDEYGEDLEQPWAFSATRNEEVINPGVLRK